MTFVPYPYPFMWNGPICPRCNQGYIQTTTTPTFYSTHYQPRHRKPGPAQ